MDAKDERKSWVLHSRQSFIADQGIKIQKPVAGFFILLRDAKFVPGHMTRLREMGDVGGTDFFFFRDSFLSFPHTFFLVGVYVAQWRE
jgi:hypothetical protein